MREPLVKRLRIPCFEIGLDECWIDPERIEAADRIEDLEAQLYAAAPDLHRICGEQADETERLREALAPCVKMLLALVAESGRGVEWDEEDAFRMGEWFEQEDLAAIEAARKALE